MRHPLAFLVVFLPLAAAAQVPWSGSGWDVGGEQSRIEHYLGREALLLHNGYAWLDSADFRDGIIELDLAVTAVQGFHGVAFRAADRENYEQLYLRPQQSGNPDATQLQPVYNGVAAWQIYSSARFAQPMTITPDRWMHVRIVVAGRRLELSVDGETIAFPELQRPLAAGGIGLLSGGVEPARFANVVIRPGATAAPAQTGEIPPPPQLAPGIVREWRVSSPFAEERVRGDGRLGAAASSDLTWRTLGVTENGVANLAALHGRSAERNSVFAALTLRAARARPVSLRFGFSDRVVVFLDGRPLYRGNDLWRSRDYRFLGTIGLWDEVILPLRRGENQVWLAVSEDFGGWGVIAELGEREGVEIVSPATVGEE